MCVHVNDVKKAIACPELNTAYFLDDFIAPANHQYFLGWFATLIVGSVT